MRNRNIFDQRPRLHFIPTEIALGAQPITTTPPSFHRLHTRNLDTGHCVEGLWGTRKCPQHQNTQSIVLVNYNFQHILTRMGLSKNWPDKPPMRPDLEICGTFV
jgi:hypothetical protein